jgi:hypothetical protein
LISASGKGPAPAGRTIIVCIEIPRFGNGMSVRSATPPEAGRCGGCDCAYGVPPKTATHVLRQAQNNVDFAHARPTARQIRNTFLEYLVDISKH